MTGSHTHLINFDTLIVSKLGNSYPTFDDLEHFQEAAI